MSPPILSSPSLSHHLLGTKISCTRAMEKKNSSIAPSCLCILHPSYSFRLHLMSLSPSSGKEILLHGKRISSTAPSSLSSLRLCAISLSLSLISLLFLSSSLSFSSSHVKPLPHLSHEISHVQNLIAILFSILRHADLSSLPFLSSLFPHLDTREKSFSDIRSENQN